MELRSSITGECFGGIIVNIPSPDSVIQTMQSQENPGSDCVCFISVADAEVFVCLFVCFEIDFCFLSGLRNNHPHIIHKLEQSFFHPRTVHGKKR